MGVGTIGAQLLKERFLTQAEVARRVGVSKQVVSRWVAGEKRPDPERRALLEQAFGIPIEAWLEPEERDPGAPGYAAIVAKYMRRVQELATQALAEILRKTL
jgi:transcriptional regulator with XRE-family HTH domain